MTQKECVRAYYVKNREKVIAASSTYNREHKAQRARRQRERYRSDTVFRQKVNARTARWAKSERGREKRRISDKAWLETHPEAKAMKLKRHAEYVHEYQTRPKVRERRRRYMAGYLKIPVNRIAHNMRVRFGKVLRGLEKSASVITLLGCSLDEFRLRMECMFQPGMTWENSGKVWHLDHVRPCASFDLTDPDQLRACFHYLNYQPLWARDNLIKGARCQGTVEPIPAFP
jgi:hypothetical protein